MNRPKTLSRDASSAKGKTTSAQEKAMGAHLNGHRAIKLLQESYAYARQLNRSPWDFAVEIATLREQGLTDSDMRWLTCSGFLEHGRETTRFGAEVRTFIHDGGLRFGRRTCFVFTEAGQANYSHTPIPDITCRDAERKHEHGGEAGPELEAFNGDPELFRHKKPTWDRARGVLRVGEHIVKQFRVPAPNQEVILAAFAEEDWPVRIDDPLSPSPDTDPKKRLHDTINSLNRHQISPLIRFRGDGNGQGVLWELTLPDRAGLR